MRYNTDPICIYFLENLIEHEQELFMLHQLKVKNTLFEHFVLKWAEHRRRDFRTTFFEFTLDVDLVTEVIHFFNDLL